MQYIYTMNGVSKTVPPKRQIIKDISLSFFPGAKIGLLGLNGAGKSTVLRIMAGVDTDFSGEARPQAGIKVGYLAQEPQLDPTHTVRQAVEVGLGEIINAQAALDAVYAAYAEEDADFNRLAYAVGRVELRLLRQVTDLDARLRTRLAGKIGIDAGHEPQHRRLARAVEAEQADRGAREERQRDVLDDLALRRHDLADAVHGVDVLHGDSGTGTRRAGPDGLGQGGGSGDYPARGGRVPAQSFAASDGSGPRPAAIQIRRSGGPRKPEGACGRGPLLAAYGALGYHRR